MDPSRDVGSHCVEGAGSRGGGAATTLALAGCSPSPVRRPRRLRLPSCSRRRSSRSTRRCRSGRMQPRSQFQLPLNARLDSRERVLVRTLPDGDVLAVRVVQRLSLTGTGDYFLSVPAPLLDVRAAPGSQAEPGFRRSGIVWQGFANRGRVLIADAKSGPRPRGRGPARAARAERQRRRAGAPEERTSQRPPPGRAHAPKHDRGASADGVGPRRAAAGASRARLGGAWRPHPGAARGGRRRPGTETPCPGGRSARRVRRASPAGPRARPGRRPRRLSGQEGPRVGRPVPARTGAPEDLARDHRRLGHGRRRRCSKGVAHRRADRRARPPHALAPRPSRRAASC